MLFSPLTTEMYGAVTRPNEMSRRTGSSWGLPAVGKEVIRGTAEDLHLPVNITCKLEMKFL
jgi:hypothetical protein